MTSSGEPRPPRNRAALLLVLTLAAGAWWLGRGDAAQPPAAAAAADRPPAASTFAELADDGSPGDLRQPAGATPPGLVPAPPADLRLPYRFALHVQVTDAFGLPVPDANLFVAPEGGGFGLWPRPTDGRGRLDFSCRGRSQRVRLWCAIVARGVIEWLELLELEDGAARQLPVTARGDVVDTSRLEELLAEDASPEQLRDLADQDRRAASTGRSELRAGDDRQQRRRGSMRRRDEDDFLCGRTLMLFRDMQCATCHIPSQLVAYTPLGWAPDLVPRAHPDAVFSDLRWVPPDADEREERARRVQMPGDERRWRATLEETLGSTQPVHGVVRTASGQFPGVVPVAWLDDDGAMRFRTWTDPQGRYQLPVVPRRPTTVRVGGGAAGTAMATFVVAGATSRDFVLGPTPLLRGTALDEQGRPLSDWRVTFHGDSEPFAAFAVTDTDGRFVVQAAVASGHCLLWPDAGDLTLPVLRSAEVFLSGAEVELRLPSDPPSRARLRLRPLLPPTHTGMRIEMRVVQVATGLATHLSASGWDEAFELEGLAAGFYRGEIGAPKLGWVSFGPIHIDGRGLWNCGTIALPVPGRARFRLDLLPPGTTRRREFSPFTFVHAIYRQTAEFDQLAPTATIDPDDPEPVVELPVGDYALVWRRPGDPTDELRSAAFSIRSGSETVVVIPGD